MMVMIIMMLLMIMMIIVIITYNHFDDDDVHFSPVMMAIGCYFCHFSLFKSSFCIVLIEPQDHL